MEKNDGDKPSGPSSPCRELRELHELHPAEEFICLLRALDLLSDEQFCRELVTQYHGGPAPQYPSQPNGMEKNDDGKATGSSSPCHEIVEILAAELLSGMALDRLVTPCFCGPAPENPAQPGGGSVSASGDSEKPEIAEPLQLQEGRGGPDPSPSQISSGSSGKAVGTSGSVGSPPELERGPDCEAPGSGSGRSVHVQELDR